MVDPEALPTAPDENSTCPTYCFSGENINVGVTKQGGYLCYMRVSRDVGDPEKSVDNAFTIAREYLEKVGMGSMKDSYYEVANGICTHEFRL